MCLSYRTRLYTPQDYQTIASWLEARGWPAPPDAASLPTCGIVVEGKEKPLAAGFLYYTNSDIAWVGWPCSDPSSAKLERDQALDIMLEGLAKMAKVSGYKKIWTTTGHAALSARFDRLEWNKGDENITNFIKVL